MKRATDKGVGAQVIGRGSNKTNLTKNATMHAEFVAAERIMSSRAGVIEHQTSPVWHTSV